MPDYYYSIGTAKSQTGGEGRLVHRPDGKINVEIWTEQIMCFEKEVFDSGATVEITEWSDAEQKHVPIHTLHGRIEGIIIEPDTDGSPTLVVFVIHPAGKKEE